MVIIFSKTLETKKGVDVRSEDSELHLHQVHNMSRGTTLISCGAVEADVWLDLGRGCAIQRGAPCQASASLDSLWDALPGYQRRSWGREGPGTASAITSLIHELNLGDAKLGAPPSLPHASATAPPSKRHCRSLSLSDEFGRCRSSWRPQGSRVWMAVEKRRCYSGGSVQRYPGGGGGVAGISGGHFPAMQRSSSFSLPSHSSSPTDRPLELPCFSPHLPPLFTALPRSPSHPHQQLSLRPLSQSHEQISLLEPRAGDAPGASSPDSTPEMVRRGGQRPAGAGGLSRSMSHPCVLNEKKIGMKRRRAEDPQEPRPSLDLAKMTQKLPTFHSLSCPWISPRSDSYQSSLSPPSSWSFSQSDADFAPVSNLGGETEQEACRQEEEEDSSYEELDSDSLCSGDSRPGSPGGVGGRPGGDRSPLWRGDSGTGKDIYQLGGELDIDQIEKN
ncbi:protein FAM53B-like isoform X1 [Hypomesus transpacificus]|uniref:protein FAM53B-like isoform X1 n=1 Tax=Hypomesus transpacificus TaxID=137520 RepID=UPI001F072089|nr:protein FAM53B-like isoform X1 [Hypomesus transpacificus]